MDFIDVQEFISRRGFTQLSNAELLGIINDVLREWSLVRGPIVIETFKTSAGEYAYDYPDEAYVIVDVFWSPADNFQESIQELLVKLQESDDIYFRSVRLINDIDIMRLTSKIGTWEDRGGFIVLYPTPMDSQDVVIVYRKLASLSDILPKDESLFLEGVAAFSAQAVGQRRIVSGGWRAGRVSVDSTSGKVMLDYANRSIDNWRKRIGLGVISSGGRS